MRNAAPKGSVAPLSLGEQHAAFDNAKLMLSLHSERQAITY